MRSATSISDTIVQYRSAQKSVITRIFGMPNFSQQGMTIETAREIAETLLSESATYRDREECS